MGTLDVEVTAALPDVDARAMLAEGTFIDLTKRLEFLGGTRRVFAAKESVDWLKHAAELSLDSAITGSAMMTGVCLGEVAQYALVHDGVIDRAQFYHETNWSNPEWPQFAAIVLCWDAGDEETCAVWGFFEHLKTLGLLTDQKEGSLS